MARKKTDHLEDTEQQALERRVDTMMSVEKLPEQPAPIPEETKPVEKPAKEPTKVTISDQSTAPQLPPQLLKTIGKNKVVKSSIKIIKDKPDEESPEPVPADPLAEAETPEPVKPQTQETVSESKPLADYDPLEDSATDKAVDSIVAEEANMQLAVNDAVTRQKAAEAEGHGPGWLHRFFTSPWTWLFIIGIAGVTYAWFH